MRETPANRNRDWNPYREALGNLADEYTREEASLRLPLPILVCINGGKIGDNDS
jgi:hypothetical protein